MRDEIMDTWMGAYLSIIVEVALLAPFVHPRRRVRPLHLARIVLVIPPFLGIRRDLVLQ